MNNNGSPFTINNINTCNFQSSNAYDLNFRSPNPYASFLKTNNTTTNRSSQTSSFIPSQPIQNKVFPSPFVNDNTTVFGMNSNNNNNLNSLAKHNFNLNLTGSDSAFSSNQNIYNRNNMIQDNIKDINPIMSSEFTNMCYCNNNHGNPYVNSLNGNTNESILSPGINKNRGTNFTYNQVSNPSNKMVFTPGKDFPIINTLYNTQPKIQPQFMNSAQSSKIIYQQTRPVIMFPTPSNPGNVLTPKLNCNEKDNNIVLPTLINNSRSPKTVIKTNPPPVVLSSIATPKSPGSSLQPNCKNVTPSFIKNNSTNVLSSSILQKSINDPKMSNISVSKNSNCSSNENAFENVADDPFLSNEAEDTKDENKPNGLVSNQSLDPNSVTSANSIGTIEKSGSSDNSFHQVVDHGLFVSPSTSTNQSFLNHKHQIPFNLTPEQFKALDISVQNVLKNENCCKLIELRKMTLEMLTPEMARMIKLFVTIDSSKNFTIEYDEVQKAFSNKDYSFSSAAARMLTRLFAKDSRISFDGFLKMDKFITRCRQMFVIYDRDRSNSIDYEELTFCMQNLGIRSPQKETVQALISCFDKTGEGTLTYSGFVSCCVVAALIQTIYDSLSKKTTPNFNGIEGYNSIDETDEETLVINKKNLLDIILYFL